MSDVWTDGLIAETAGALVEQGHVAVGFDFLYSYAGATNHAAPQLAALGAMWGKLDPAQRERVVELVATSLRNARPDLSGTAAEVLTTILAGLVGDEPAVVAARERLEQALLDAAKELAADPELVSTMIATIGTAKVARGLPVCRDALAHANVVVRGAARDCVIALGDADPGAGAASALTMPADVDPAPLLVAGVRVTWILETTYGEVRIALDPRRAPWTVASLVALTRRDFYANNVFHRVVPGFVVQGGDPDGTGWGGPGYTLPAEPSLAPYATGAIGIADAGKDTGGSQWFSMHGPAPHLDARYTQVGEVIAGAEVIDALQVGDFGKVRVEIQ
jgi:cyclophilin family peptidyl-prolyl cis-trans isomerase